MSPILTQHYGPTEGPLGFPLTDRQAQELDALLKTLPRGDEFRYRKAVVAGATTELSPGERADVSWISTEDPDRTGEVVIARGMNDSQFAHNPIVTLNHCYGAAPAGKSLWRKRVKGPDGLRQGIKAKTHYPARPASWPSGTDWVPDIALALVQADLLRGKSIGFLPTRVHVPTPQELEAFRNGPDGAVNVHLVIDEWLLLEYACVFLPAQQNAVVEQVSKSLPLSADVARILGLELPAEPRLPALVPHCRLETIEKALTRAIDQLDFHHLAERSIQERIDRLRGRV